MDQEIIYAIRHDPDGGWEYARVVPTERPEWFSLCYPDLTLAEGMDRLYGRGAAPAPK